MPPRPSTLIAELSYQCPLHCPYCSNPLDIGGDRYRRELETEHWIRTFVQAPRDAQYALDLVVERCATREQQERAVAALRFKTEMLWAQLEAIERGDTQPPAAP